MKRLPTMTKLEETQNATRWKAQFPSTAMTIGAVYHVTTYPGSELVFVETWVKRRIVNGERVKQSIRQAIKAPALARKS